MVEEAAEGDGASGAGVCLVVSDIVELFEAVGSKDGEGLVLRGGYWDRDHHLAGFLQLAFAVEGFVVGGGWNRAVSFHIAEVRGWRNEVNRIPEIIRDGVRGCSNLVLFSVRIHFEVRVQHLVGVVNGCCEVHH